MDHKKIAEDIRKNAQHILGNFANFDGRAGLREFWLWFLPLLAVSLLLQALGQAMSLFTTISGLIGIALLIPTLAVGARRLHDTGKSGWLQLLLFIPVAGLLVLAYFWAQPAKAKD